MSSYIRQCFHSVTHCSVQWLFRFRCSELISYGVYIGEIVKAMRIYILFLYIPIIAYISIYQVSGTHRSVANNGHLIRNHQMECAMNALWIFSSLLLLLFIIPKKCQRVDNNWNHWQRKYGREQFGVWCPRFWYSRQPVQLLGCFQNLHTNVVTEINRQSVFRTEP